MLKYFISTLILLSSLYVISCSEDSSTGSSGLDAEFILLIRQGEYDDITRDNMSVYFITTDSTSTPSVDVNGYSITAFETYSGSLTEGKIVGRLQLPFSNSINYSVSKDGNTTSGSINMPVFPSNVSVNGIELMDVTDSPENEIPSSNSLQFTWDCAFFDYFSYSMEGGNYPNGTTTDKFITLDPSGSNYFEFYIRSANGVDLGSVTTLSEIEPNVTGDYGKGYVAAWLDSDNYNIKFSN